MHYAYVVYVAGASVHTLSAQVPDDPLAVHVHDLAPDVARFPKIIRILKYQYKVLV